MTNWLRTQVVVAEVVGHARVLLRGHIAADATDVVKCALVGACSTTEIRRCLKHLMNILRCVALDRLRSAVVAITALALRSLSAAGDLHIVDSTLAKHLSGRLPHDSLSLSGGMRGKVSFAGTILNFQHLLSRLLSEHHACWNL